MKTSLLLLTLCLCLSLVAGCASAPAPAATYPPAASQFTSTSPAPTSTLTPQPPTMAPTAAPTSSSQPSQGVQPPKLGYHATAYDSRADRVIVVPPGCCNSKRDTWAYDIATNTWTNIAPAQLPVQGEGPMDYDSASDRTIYYAGNSAPSGISSLAAANQTWAYDYNTDTWTDLQSTGTPSGLLGARMVYDTKADRMVLFGGLNVPIIGTYNTDTWVYDFNTSTWTNMHPTTSPPGQNFFPMVYDAASDRVLAWIKPDDDGDNNMWAYDLTTNTWTSTPITEPAYRTYDAMVYVPTVKLDFVFGGVYPDPDTETPYNDMWTYNAVTNTWEQVPFTSGPSARGWYTMSYSTKSDRIVLIGGGADRNSFTNEVWIFDPNAKTWTQVGPK